MPHWHLTEKRTQAPDLSLQTPDPKQSVTERQGPNRAKAKHLRGVQRDEDADARRQCHRCNSHVSRNLERDGRQRFECRPQLKAPREHQRQRWLKQMPNPNATNEHFCRQTPVTPRGRRSKRAAGTPVTDAKFRSTMPDPEFIGFKKFVVRQPIHQDRSSGLEPTDRAIASLRERSVTLRFVTNRKIASASFDIISVGSRPKFSEVVNPCGRTARSRCRSNSKSTTIGFAADWCVRAAKPETGVLFPMPDRARPNPWWKRTRRQVERLKGTDR